MDMDLINTTRKGLSCLGLPCQILSQCWSGPPAQPMSCWGRSHGHSIVCLTAQMAVELLYGMIVFFAGACVIY